MYTLSYLDNNIEAGGTYYIITSNDILDEMNIKSGGKLYIKNNIAIPESKTITVESGGKISNNIIINGGTLNTIHGVLLQDIYVTSNSELNLCYTNTDIDDFKSGVTLVGSNTIIENGALKYGDCPLSGSISNGLITDLAGDCPWRFSVSNGFTISNVTFTSGARIYAKGGGNYFINCSIGFSGNISIQYEDIASNIILGSTGYPSTIATCQVYSSGLAKNIIVSAGGLLSIWGNGNALITELHSGGRIRTGQTASDIENGYVGHISGISVIDSAGIIQASAGGTIKDITPKTSTKISAYTNGTATNIKTSELFSGTAIDGTLSDILISSGGSAILTASSNGTISDITCLSGGILNLKTSNSIVSNIIISSGGKALISSGTTISNITFYGGGNAIGNKITGPNILISNLYLSNNTHISAITSATIIGGTAINYINNSSGTNRLGVAMNGGSLNNYTLTTSDNNVLVNAVWFNISNNATCSNITVEKRARLQISSSYAEDIKIISGGTLWLYKDTIGSNIIVSGNKYKPTSSTSYPGSCCVMNGGTAIDVKVYDSNTIIVSSGGSLINISGNGTLTVNSAGYARINTATEFTGTLNSSAGATIDFITE